MPAHQGEKKENKSNLFQSVWHTDVRSAVLHPHTDKAAFRDPSPTIDQNYPGKQQRSRLRSLDLCSAQQTNGNGSSPASEVCLAPLHSGKGCQFKYERATCASAHSHLKQPGSCLLDISSPFSFPPNSWVQYRHTFPATQTHVWLTSSFTSGFFFFFVPDI